MANRDLIRGGRPVKYLNGRPYNGAFNTYTFASGDTTAAYIGDLVTHTGTYTADATGTKGVVTQSAASQSNAVGFIVGFKVDPTDLSLNYRKASTDRDVFVADDPDLLFEIQESGNIGIAAAGLNADIVVGTASTTTGLSGMELDSDTEATTTTLPLKIHAMVAREDNEVGTNAKWLVSLNTPWQRNTTGDA